MTTGTDIITAALKKSGVLGVGQSASAEDTTDAFNDLNQMLAQWQRKRWMVYHLVDVSYVSTGAQSYTVGTGGNFNVARPDRLEASFFRQTIPSQPNLIDYPLQLLEAREDYNNIALKSLTTFPQYAFYDAAYPTGNLYVWPVPTSGIYEIHITLKEQLGSLAAPGSVINLPPEYMAALIWNLAARLRPSYQLQPDPTVTAMAKDSLNLINNANAQVPRLRMPSDLVRGGIYNIYSDRSN